MRKDLLLAAWRKAYTAYVVETSARDDAGAIADGEAQAVAMLAAALAAQGEPAPTKRQREIPARGEAQFQETAPAPVTVGERSSTVQQERIAMDPVTIADVSIFNGTGRLAALRAAAASPVPAAEGTFGDYCEAAVALERELSQYRPGIVWDADTRNVLYRHLETFRASSAPVAAEGLDVETLARETREAVTGIYERDSGSWKSGTAQSLAEQDAIILAALRAVTEARR